MIKNPLRSLRSRAVRHVLAVVFCACVTALTLPQVRGVGNAPDLETRAKTGVPYGRVHVLLIGIDRYKSPSIPTLKYVKNDLAAYREVFTKRYNVDPKLIQELYGPQATRKNIERAVNSYLDPKKVSETDALLVVYCGHGAKVKGEGFLLPYDAALSLKSENLSEFRSEALQMSLLSFGLEKSPARHVLTILDACHGGAALKRGPALNPPADPQENDFLAINFARPGREVLAATSENQQAAEDETKKLGKFTSVVISELKARAQGTKPFFGSDFGSQIQQLATFTRNGVNQTPVYERIEGCAGTFTFFPSSYLKARSVTETPEFYAAMKAVNLNTPGAADLIRPYAEKGIPKAMGLYAQVMLYAAVLGKSNSSESYTWAKRAADAGDPLGMTDLGYALANGLGVPRDHKEAVKWFRKAAALGNSDAMQNLGYAYMYGNGVTEDKKEAVNWYLKAADLGNSWSMIHLGFAYQYDGYGVAKDLKKTVQWYRKAADIGDVYAMYLLANCYERGEGVTQDPRQAAKWYLSAAKVGHVDSMKSLASCYESGFGVLKDLSQARFWSEKAGGIPESPAGVIERATKAALGLGGF